MERSGTLSMGDILLVDDVPANLQILAQMLKERGYATRPTPSGKLAIQAAELEPPDLILLDINMPDLDGYQVCQVLKANPRLKEIPVIFISALTETLDKVKAFSVGGVDYITKPFQIDEVYARVETQLKVRRLQLELKWTIQGLEEKVREQVKEISDSQFAMIFALAKLAESRDDETGKHLERVRTFCKLLASGLFYQDKYSAQVSDQFIETIYHASPLHDIGKVGIPDRILLKPGKLTPEEFDVMKMHPLLGSRTLEAVCQQYPNNSIINMAIEIARSHHEWWNGSGYPDRLAGVSIPLPARIMAVADVYDALRSKRVYKPPFTHQASTEMILNSSGTHLDPVVVAVFLELEMDFDHAYERLIDIQESSLERINSERA